MPYIDARTRDYLNTSMDMSGPGELNYMLTKICKLYLDKFGESYRTYNDIIGALEGCKLELYRRKTVPYEERKIKQNGDVWE